MITRRLLGATALTLLASPQAFAQDQSVIVQPTTSTANSGLYDYLLPIFEEASGIEVNVVAVGTGQAIQNARSCDGDVLLVHAKPAEEQFVADGMGTERTNLMYNDYVIVGPESDPAGIGDMTDAQEALAQLFGLGFVPVVEERFDLLVDRKAWFDPPMRTLMVFCGGEAFHARAAALAGYTVARPDEVRWNA